MRTLREALLKFARVMLMLWCNLTLIFQVLVQLAAPRTDEATANVFTRVEPQSSHLGLSLAISLLAAVGIHGCWRRDARSLKAFSLLAMLLVVYLHLFWQRQKRDAWQEMRPSFAAKMDLLGLQYQMGAPTPAPTYSFTSPATIIWDSLQANLRCCGLDGPSDWSQRWQKSHLPASCCNAPSRTPTSSSPLVDGCEFESAEQAGCLKRIDESLRPQFEYTYILVCLTGFLLAKHYEDQTASADESSGAAPGGEPSQQRLHQHQSGPGRRQATVIQMERVKVNDGSPFNAPSSSAPTR